MIAPTFDLFSKNPTPFDNVLQDWFILCVCWKKLGEKKIHSVSLLDDKKRFEKDHTDDYHVVKTIHEVLGEADMIVGHNIARFDWRKLNTRFVYHGLDPLPKPRMADTLAIAKKEFYFSSNKLDYIAQYLGVGQKMDTPKGLWLQTLVGDKKALKTMVDYCKQDVQVSEDVYLKLRPYYTTHPNLSTVDDNHNGKCKCPKCHSENLHKRGTSHTNAGVFQRYKCTDCNGWSRGRENLASKKHTGVAPTHKYLSSQ
jgi:DNA polymerase elongation subunit (family B)